MRLMFDKLAADVAIAAVAIALSLILAAYAARNDSEDA